MVADMGVVLSILAQEVEEPDPSLVTPGSLGLAIVLLLGLAVVLLFKSMNKQLKRIDLPGEDGPGPRATPPGAHGAAAPDDVGQVGGRSGAHAPGHDGPDGEGDAQPAR